MMHRDQISVDLDGAREMIFDQFPQFRYEQIAQLEAGGTDNAIFRIGSAAAARFPLRRRDPLECASVLNSEAGAMAELAEHCPFPTPQPVGLGRPGPLYPMPWAVQTWIAGDIATPNGLAGSRTFALNLASLITSLRAVATRGRHFDGHGRGGNLPDHDEWMTVCFENSEDRAQCCRTACCTRSLDCRACAAMRLLPTRHDHGSGRAAGRKSSTDRCRDRRFDHQPVSLRDLSARARGHPCGRLSRIEEENWFFRLSRYERALRDLYVRGAIEIIPETRRNEVLSWIDGGLEDFSVSRSAARARGWGIPVPGDPDQVIYVWFDALGNYFTALGYGSDDDDTLSKWWTEAVSREHVIGKGITRFHAVYWPAMLLSAGLPVPTRILVHGYVTVEGRKIGKSAGNAIDPVPLAEEFGSDALRYFLLRHIRSTGDGDFSHTRFRQAYESELAGQFGNLVHRVLSMIERYCEGAIPQQPEFYGG